MSLIINGVEIPTNGSVFYNGTDLDKIICNGVVVWEKIAFTTKEFDYTGGMQSCEVSSGLYKLEVWGAQGGNAEGRDSNSNSLYTGVGGYGGYSLRHVYIPSNATLFVCVGGRGDNSYVDSSGVTLESCGGYNGGGFGYLGPAGGGATHISITEGALLADFNGVMNNILIVAGGGGGAGYSLNTIAGNNGGLGGGIYGGSGEPYTYESGIIEYKHGMGATESGPGWYSYNDSSGKYELMGSKGKGGGLPYAEETDSDKKNHGWSGGGSGLYGGGGAGNWNGVRAAGGGSGYIGPRIMPEDEYFTIHNNTKYMNGSFLGRRAGNGFARITRISD